MSTRTAFRSAAGFAAALLSIGALAGPALGESSSTTVDVAAGADGVVVGTATFTRTSDADGNETLDIELAVEGGISESAVCLSDEPFTSRLPRGRCPYRLGADGATYSIDLGTAYAGETTYVQVSVATGDETAFAGLVSANPPYGNVELAATAAVPLPPTALGGLALPALLGATVLLGQVARRRARPLR